MSKNNQAPKILPDLTQENKAPEQIQAPITNVQPSQLPVRLDDKGRMRDVTLTYDQIKDAGVDIGNKSMVMRYLWSLNYSRSAIATFLNVRYQFVREVLTRLPKKPETFNVPAQLAANTQSAATKDTVEGGEGI
jgi:hypothetical protein